MKKIIILATLFLSSFVFVFAQADITKQSFKDYIELGFVSIKVPTVVEAKILSTEISREIIGVFDKTTNKFIPHFFLKSARVIVPKINDLSTGKVFPELVDGDYSTYAEFPLLVQNESSATTFEITSDIAITSDTLHLIVDQYTSLPKTISISVPRADGSDKIVLSNAKVLSETIHFPKETSKSFVVEVTYSQPLRIVDMFFNNTKPKEADYSSVRFLALPQHEYLIYLNGDRYIKQDVGESANLYSDDGVKVVLAPKSILNTEYVESDMDNDGIVDRLDNCVSVPNSDQIDVDLNGRGDQCDDFDKDGIINAIDNCIDSPNRDQADIDRDGKGDVCDDGESRITEKYPILVWGGIGFAVIIFIILYAVSIRKMKEEKNNSDLQ